MASDTQQLKLAYTNCVKLTENLSECIKIMIQKKPSPVEVL